MSRFHAMQVAEAAAALGTDLEQGLLEAEAARRLAEIGPNQLPAAPREGWPARLLRHLRDPMIILLLVAATISGAALGELADAVAIIVIVALNVVIGMVQEARAERALASLATMLTKTARVRRGGLVRLVDAAQIVPGDVVLLAPGDSVPADLRLVDGSSLAADEAALTGESLAVEKEAGALADADAPVSERRCMLFAGTVITRGAGRAVVVATGVESELGAIAARLLSTEVATPVQAELRRLATILGAAAVLVAAAVLGLILLRDQGNALGRAFLAAVALAVAAVPEGLATVVTITLALGVRRMAGRGAIVRRLPAVETLGSATVILTDKTGTITENRMRLVELILPDGSSAAPEAAPEAALRAMALCNDAVLEPPSGDPLEIALLAQLGPARTAALREAAPRLAEVPFDSERKQMTTVHRIAGQLLLVTKGAPEVLLEQCGTALGNDGSLVPLDAGQKRRLLERVAAAAASGTRLIALAERRLAAEPASPRAMEHELTLLGLAGLRDPVRAEARETVAEARSAGVQIVMVSGDHAGTARWAAEQVGLVPEGARVLTGRELRRDGIPTDPLAVRVYARTDPDQKLALAERLRVQGHVVAVTGDGVNDAPALHGADIGVAMGKSGTEVAKQAADLVITDDNLATVVAAIREGRGIFANIRKVVEYLVAGNLSEILVVVVGLLAFPELGVPLSPLQLLWINLLTDGLPALALSTDPIDPDVMRRPPRLRGERFITRWRMLVLSGRALTIAAAALGALAAERYLWEQPWARARGAMFSVLVGAHLLYAFVVHRPGRLSLFTNRWLFAAVAASLMLQNAVMAWGPAQRLLDATPLAPREWVLVLGAGLVPSLVMTLFARMARNRLAR